jgi:hypothetical protein
MKIPRALRVARAGFTPSSTALGIYTRGPANAPRDLPDALQGHRQIDFSTTASSVAAIASAAANSHKRRG